jgi:hypothetical protein
MMSKMESTSNCCTTAMFLDPESLGSSNTEGEMLLSSLNKVGGTRSYARRGWRFREVGARGVEDRERGLARKQTSNAI